MHEQNGCANVRRASLSYDRVDNHFLPFIALVAFLAFAFIAFLTGAGAAAAAFAFIAFAILMESWKCVAQIVVQDCRA